MSNKLKSAINVNWRVMCRRSLFYFKINTSWRYYLEHFETCLLQPILYQCSLKFDWFPVFCSICCVSRYLPTSPEYRDNLPISCQCSHVFISVVFNIWQYFLQRCWSMKVFVQNGVILDQV